jgi:hypothetical protein
MYGILIEPRRALEIAERRAAHELGREEQTGRVDPPADEVHDVVVLDRRRDARLVDEHLHELRIVREILVQTLHGDERTRRVVRSPRELDASHATATQLPEYLEGERLVRGHGLAEHRLGNVPYATRTHFGDNGLIFVLCARALHARASVFPPSPVLHRRCVRLRRRAPCHRQSPSRRSAEVVLRGRPEGRDR